MSNNNAIFPSKLNYILMVHVHPLCIGWLRDVNAYYDSVTLINILYLVVFYVQGRFYARPDEIFLYSPKI
ncbi:unnamed protein product [Brassica rapa subsp. narinosa]